MQPSYVISVLTAPTMLFLKLTFFVMYLHIFGPMRWLRICGYIGALFTTTFYGSMTIAIFIFTTPGHGETWWSHQTTPHEHLSLLTFVPQTVVGLAIDIAILIIPILTVTQLQLPTRRIIGIILIFMTGLL